MDWCHKSSLEWLKARQDFISASEIASLVPYSRTGRKRTITDVDRMKLLSGKHQELVESDTVSYGAMARGHILEPYAVEEFNLYADSAGLPKLYHWDDAIVTNGGYVGYSPDALDVQQTSADAVQFTSDLLPKAIGEIKSYTAQRHTELLYTTKDLIEERWQIAVGLYASPTIQDAFLILYNPSLTRDHLGVVHWTREELENELEEIERIEEDWIKFIKDEPASVATIPTTRLYTESAIIAKEAALGMFDPR